VATAWQNIPFHLAPQVGIEDIGLDATSFQRLYVRLAGKGGVGQQAGGCGHRSVTASTSGSSAGLSFLACVTRGVAMK